MYVKSKSLLFFPILLFFSHFVQAQLGIGTSNPNASAQLDVSSSTKGFLPPRISLTATNSNSPISSPATGLLVYNTNTAGTAPNNVTPGFYYYDGAKWQRIINQQPDATISFNQNTPTTAGVVFTPNTQNSTDYIYVSSTNNSQWTYNGSTYVTYTPPSSTAWYSSGGTLDAGSNKSGTVYRTGSVGIGTATSPDASALLDVNSSTKGFLPPRVSLTASNAAGPIASPATGLLVFNLATAGTYPNNVTPGYYYYDGSGWQKLSTGSTGDIPNWTSAGAISFGATTTAPTIGTVTVNNMRYRQLGTKEWEVVMSFNTTGAGGVAGLGDYLFTLPNSLSFDLTLPWQTAYTANTAIFSNEFQRYAIPMSSGYFANSSNGQNSTGTYIIPYNSTKFRIIFYVHGAGIAPWGGGFHPMTNNMGGNWTFRFTAQ